jgi:superoxide dismutase, Fe-Mn family
MIERLGIPGFLRPVVAGAMGGGMGPGGRESVPQPAAATGQTSPEGVGEKPSVFQLPDLPYAFDALEPYIDEQTMRIHHGKHHAGYVANLNKALETQTDWTPKTILEVCMGIAKAPEAIRTAVRNNGGGHYNHSLFWTLMAPAGTGGGGEPTGALAEAIQTDLGGFSALKEALTKAAVGRFGSGWAWLCLGENNKLFVSSTPNQDNPLMTDYVDRPGTPILGLDVWEHAYYLKYQNRRPDYVEAWWNVVNWSAVLDRYTKARR